MNQRLLNYTFIDEPGNRGIGETGNRGIEELGNQLTS